MNKCRFRSSSSPFFLLAWLFLLPSCKLFLPYDSELAEHPDFSDPRQSFHSFVAAVREEIPEAELRCFSESFKERYDFTLEKYSLARPRILAEYPKVQYVGWMGVKSFGKNDESHAFVLASFMTNKLLVRLVRQQYAYITLRDGTSVDFWLREPVAKNVQTEDNRWTIVLESPYLRGVKREDIDSIQLLPEWKIEAFEQVVEPEKSPQG